MADTSNAILQNNYRAAVRALELKLSRQLQSVQATEGQIEGFKALIEQLDSKSGKK